MRRAARVAIAICVAACGATSSVDSPDVGDSMKPEDTLQPAAPCEGELAWFESAVHQAILVGRCVVCHSADGIASKTRMVLKPDDPAHNWLQAGTLAAHTLEGESVLLLRATGAHPRGHPGVTLDEGSASLAALEDFVTRAVDPACNAADEERCDDLVGRPVYGPRLLRRLSRAEYDATLASVFSRTSTLGRSLAADPAVYGFDNNAAALVVAPLLADQLRLNAEALAEAAVQDLDRVLPCVPAQDAEGCRDLFIERFGARAFRRPLKPYEVARYRTLFLATQRGAFENGVRWVITAMLQSPHFLYRGELGALQGSGHFQLNEYEIASALSYFLTGGPPDDVLVRAAEQGRLQDPDERARQARRLVVTQAGQRALARFFFAWLGLDRLQNVGKDAVTYPGFNEQTRRSMEQETQRFVVRALLAGSGRLPELFLAPYTFVDQNLESFYGRTAQGEPDLEGFRRLETQGEHYGLLSQGSLLTVWAGAADASPIRRGKLIRERLLCEMLPPPPPGVVVELPPRAPAQTERERYALHSEIEPCKSCHRLIDPIGFGFSAYDGVGRFRTEEAGRPVDASGEIVDTPSTDGTFEDLGGLANLLAGSEDVHACFLERWMRWAYGVAPDGNLSCVLEEVRSSFEAEDLRVEALLVALARSEHMRMRSAD